MGYRTKEQLMKAYHDMTVENPSGRITVVDLCTKCHIRRQTFYNYFSDIPDLVLQYCIQQIREGSRHSRRHADWQKVMQSALAYCYTDSRFIQAVLSTDAKDRLIQYSHARMHDFLCGHIEAVTAETALSTLQKDYLCRYHQHALAGIITDWFVRGMKEDPETVIDLMDDILKDSLSSAIGNFQARNDLFGMPECI
ncbi:MAG: TetR/AcrR family transcriptional regulator C-terminal domain-containing protein [Lactimicrobium sp.]|jgi:AcrR family transcriptional regulator|uniref:TetR/AcrR family transcriptional regulator n=1 Tax=Lactimicrobium sp. TaxID=2563780 RepID=UPI002F35FDDD